MFEKKDKDEKKAGRSITNMNAVSEDEDTSCEITDLNCVDGQEGEHEALDITRQNLDQDDKSCEITNLNCE